MTKHSEKGVGVPTIYFINATSPAKNHALQLFESDLQQSNVHVGCVAESWFNDKISTNYTDINGFPCLGATARSVKVAVFVFYVRNNFQSYKFCASEEFEIFWVKVCCQDNCYFIASCYPPPPPKPRYLVTDFVGQLCSTIESIIDCETNPIFLITGDFNSLATDFLEEDLILG